MRGGTGPRHCPGLRPGGSFRHPLPDATESQVSNARPRTPPARTSSWVGLALLLIVLPLLLLGGVAVRDLHRAGGEVDRLAALDRIRRKADDFVFAMRTSQVAIRDYLLEPGPVTRARAARAERRLRALGDSLAATSTSPVERSRTGIWTRQLADRSAIVDSVLDQFPADSARLRWYANSRPQFGDSLIATAQLVSAAVVEASQRNGEALDASLEAARRRSLFLLGMTVLLGAFGGGLFVRVRRQEREARERLETTKVESESIRAELRSILDGAEDGVFWYDPDGIVRYVNRAGSAALGRPAEEVVGRPVGDVLFGPIEVERWIGMIRAVATTGASQLFEYEHQMGDGVLRFFSVNLTPVRDGTGAITGVVEFARDLTAVREAERQLRRREAEFATLVEAADDVIVQIDAQFRVTYLNPAAARLSGAPASALLGQVAADIPLDERFKAIWMAAVRDAMLTARPVVVEYDYPANDGTMARYQGRFTPEPDPVHGGMGVFVIARDITELHRAAEALASREAELRATVEGVEDLLMRFDHEGRIDFINPAYSRAVGRPASFFLGQTPESVLLDPVAREQFAGALHRVLRHGTPETLEFEYRRPTERNARYYLTRFTPLRDGHGTVTGVLTLSHDLTERRATEVERERLLDELLRAKAAVTTLKGLLPTCSWCHKIRDEHGHWEQMESYIARRSEAEFTHGLCPDCAAKMLTE